MITKVINLWASPSCGKSTLAAGAFAEMKRRNISCELVTEVAKEYAWEGRKIEVWDQILIAAEQLAREMRLIGKVEYVITDSPSLLGAFYEEKYSKSSLLRHMLQKGRAMPHRQDVDVMLPRRERYDDAGRFQTKEQAMEVHQALTEWLQVFTLQPKQLESADISQLLAYLFRETPEAYR